MRTSAGGEIFRYSRAMDARQWHLMDEVFTEDAVPVLNDAEFDDLHRRLDQLLDPTALA